MKRHNKSKKLNNVLYDIRGPVLTTAQSLEAAGNSILKLHTGNPAAFGFTASGPIVDHVAMNLPNAQGYCDDSRGLFEARVAVAQYSRQLGIEGVSPGDVYIGNGVSELISLSLQALLDNGDEILVPAPDYPLWTAAVELGGGRAVHYLCDEQSDWYPDIEDIAQKITPRTRGIVIINPNNPTGAVYPREILEKIVALAEQHDLILFSDEIYDKILYDDAIHVSPASLTDRVLCVTFCGLSKVYLAAGFRTGWMILSGNKAAAADYIEGMTMLASMRLCANVPTQFAVAPALNGPQGIFGLTRPGGRLYEQRRAAYESIIQIPGVTCVKPRGAIYLFPRLDMKKFAIRDDRQMVLDLLLDQHILLVQGSGFNWHLPDHFRLVYLPDVQVINEAMAKIGRFLAGYRQVPTSEDLNGCVPLKQAV
jgi:alanine-synthesizing transaminase